jgi:hypothetical protein
MAIQRRRQRPGDLELNAAAQAAAVDGGHGGFLCCPRRRRMRSQNPTRVMVPAPVRHSPCAIGL